MVVHGAFVLHPYRFKVRSPIRWIGGCCVPWVSWLHRIGLCECDPDRSDRGVGQVLAPVSINDMVVAVDDQYRVRTIHAILVSPQRVTLNVIRHARGVEIREIAGDWNVRRGLSGKAYRCHKKHNEAVHAHFLTPFLVLERGMLRGQLLKFVRIR